jgi:hypothetical protein
LTNSIAATLAERGSRYGEFKDHAKIAQGVQDVMRAAPKWVFLDQDMKQALSVIADKIARILNGDPYYEDNWHDISGYATLIENRLNMLEQQPATLYTSEPEDAQFQEVEEPINYMYGQPSGITDTTKGATTFSAGLGPPNLL